MDHKVDIEALDQLDKVADTVLTKIDLSKGNLGRPCIGSSIDTQYIVPAPQEFEGQIRPNLAGVSCN